MKNFGSILMALAAGASFVAAIPTPPMHGAVQPRLPHEYALHVRFPKKNKHKGAAGNGTEAAAEAANNGTANAGDDQNNGNNKNNGKDGQAQHGSIDDLLGELLSGGADGANPLADILGKADKNADDAAADDAAAQKQGGIAGLLQGLLG
ncbi:hypothetical protein F4677DRAFT_218346 [Hypoxylon crocopeplum]|nr:hypothetical protein F4677DRAFT_218346 [Hypoxylon crocopeplum]